MEEIRGKYIVWYFSDYGWHVYYGCGVGIDTIEEAVEKEKECRGTFAINSTMITQRVTYKIIEVKED